MSKIKCFRNVRGTGYDQAIKKHFELLDKWIVVYEKVSELLGEKITRLAFSTERLIIDIKELTKEENIKLFKKDGELKSNTKKAKQVLEAYKEIIKESGLEKYQELRFINFAYGVLRMRGQSLESFNTSENDIYFKADFDLAKRTDGILEPITEIEYEEKYLEELKKREVAK